MKHYLPIGVIVALTATAPAIAAAAPLAPYQSTNSINVSNCGSSQCILSFPAVPAGKRLVVTSVSAQTGSLNSFVIEGNGATFFVNVNYAGASYVAQPVTIFFGPGQAPSARFFAPPGTPNTSLFVTIVGTLVTA